MSRESFVFHAEFIADLPSEYRAKFAMYAVNYGIDGIEPEISDVLENALWVRIKRRIDDDSARYRRKAGKKAPVEAPAPVEAKTQRTVMQKPTVEQVRDYCAQKNYSVDAEKFVAFYDSNGWKVGKNAMKDWHATLLTWQKRALDEQIAHPSGTIWGRESGNVDEYVQKLGGSE